MSIRFIRKDVHNAPEHSRVPPPKVVCSRFERCKGCPYPAHGFRCWSSGDDCLRERMSKINEIKEEVSHERGFE